MFSSDKILHVPSAREQVLEKQKTSKASDVYSFGMVAWEVLSRQTPWADQATPRDIYLRVVIHGDRPAIPADAPADIAEMLLGCWAQEPKQRPSFQALLDGAKVPSTVAGKVLFFSST